MDYCIYSLLVLLATASISLAGMQPKTWHVSACRLEKNKGHLNDAFYTALEQHFEIVKSSPSADEHSNTQQRVPSIVRYNQYGDPIFVYYFSDSRLISTVLNRRTVLANPTNTLAFACLIINEEPCKKLGAVSDDVVDPILINGMYQALIYELMLKNNNMDILSCNNPDNPLLQAYLKQRQVLRDECLALEQLRRLQSKNIR